MGKLLIALQFYDGDKEMAGKVARLIADLEPTHNPDVDFMLAVRFDSKPDPEVVEYVSRKFKTYTYINKHRRGVGWPFGPNELWFGVIDHIYSYTEAKLMPTYDAILTCEADACPRGPYWHKTLMASWQKVNTGKVVRVHGAMVQHPKLHINGNALFSGALPFLHEISRKIGGCPPIYGWDFFLTKQFSQLGWADCPYIKSEWQCATMSEERIATYVDSGVCLLHGVKDLSVMNYVRSRFVR